MKYDCTVRGRAWERVRKGGGEEGEWGPPWPHRVPAGRRICSRRQTQAVGTRTTAYTRESYSWTSRYSRELLSPCPPWNLKRRPPTTKAPIYLLIYLPTYVSTIVFSCLLLQNQLTRAGTRKCCVHGAIRLVGKASFLPFICRVSFSPHTRELLRNSVTTAA